MRPFRYPAPKGEPNCRIPDTASADRLRAFGLPVRRCTFQQGDPTRLLVEWRKAPTDADRDKAAIILPQHHLLHAI